MQKKHYLLLAVFALAVFFRVYRLSTVPPSASLDEVSIGYNAYSILKTGMDEYGNRFPLVLRAYDDWRPALYVYVVIPFIKLFGLTAFAVRIPSVLLSIGSVLIFYLLVKELMSKPRLNFGFGLVAAGLLALSPWHIYLSRLGHEVNLGFFLTVLGLYVFIRFLHTTDDTKNNIQTKPIYYLTAFFVVFALSFNSYQSQKIVMPLMGLVLFVIFYKEALAKWKMVLIAGCIGAVVALPVIQTSFSGQAMSRFQATSVFVHDPFYIEAEQKYIEALQHNDLLKRIMYSKKVAHIRVFVSNFISHMSFKWIFLGSLKEDHKVPYTGLLYLWEFPFLLMGIIVAFVKKKELFKDQRYVWLLVAGVVISIIPGALTTQAPHAMRTFTAVPFLILFTSIGIVSLYSRIRSYHTLYVGGVGLVILLSAAYLYKHYFYTFPKYHSDSFQYALSRSIPVLEEKKHEYDKVVVSNKDQLYQSYMFYLFHTAYDPEKYLTQGGTISGGYAEKHIIDSIEFRSIVPDEYALYSDTSVLFMTNLEERKDSGTIINVIKNKNNQDSIVIFANVL